MLTQEPTPEMYEQWKSVWKEYHTQLKPNKKTGHELLDYLFKMYKLTEIYDQKALDAIRFNVTMNKHLAEKLSDGATPSPRAFFVENTGAGEELYKDDNKDPEEIWGGDITKIFVGIDTASGFFMVEGSTMLWDRLYAVQGIDETDIKNPYCVAQYIACLKRFRLLQNVLSE